MNEFVSSLISGIVGGLLVWGFQQLYSNRREKRKEEEDFVAAVLQSKKVITPNTFNMLKPGRDINLMFEALGHPAIKAKSDSAVFSDESIETNSYLYFLKNAYLKILFSTRQR